MLGERLNGYKNHLSVYANIFDLDLLFEYEISVQANFPSLIKPVDDEELFKGINSSLKSFIYTGHSTHLPTNRNSYPTLLLMSGNFTNILKGLILFLIVFL